MDVVTVEKNDTIKESATPTKECFTFDGWYTDKDFENKYDFSDKVKKSFTLYAKWVKAEEEGETEENEETPKWENPFNDVSTSEWYYDSIKEICELELMKGMSDTEFAPDIEVTRGMFVTILYRLEKSLQHRK